MARRVFFSFHYEADSWRASIVRNHWITKPDRTSAGYLDKASWEQLYRQGDDAIKRWINKQMTGTSVTVVLIGTETYSREWVLYEIRRTWALNHGLLGIHIHNIRDALQQTAPKGPNPFDLLTFNDERGRDVKLSQVIETYDWVSDNGYGNFGDWAEDAAQDAGR